MRGLLSFILLIGAVIPPLTADIPESPPGLMLNFQNTDIDLVFKFFSEVTGRVFIKSDAVRGFVSVTSPVQVSPAEALNILQKVLEVKGFTLVELPGKIVKVLTQAEAVQSELEVGVGEGSIPLAGDRMISQVIELRFLPAQDLKGELSAMISKGGNIMSNDRTNSLVITDLASNIRRLMKIINQLDVRTPQVLIEALIMEVSLTDETKLGIEWGYKGAFQTKDHSFDESAGQNFNLGSIVTEGVKYSILRQDNNLSAMIQALSTDKNVNILSTPHILTLNNQAAFIRVGEEVPVLTQTRNIQGGETIRSFDYKSVAIELEVTPRVNQDREVFMKVHPLIKKILGVNAELNAPILATREAQTSVLVKDGQTVVIGGLMKDDRATSESKIPLLGDIPFLGYLFKRKTTTKEKTELLVFITPHVILNSEDARKMTLQKESESKSNQTPDLLSAKEHYRMGIFNYREKRIEDALKEWQKVLEISPNETLKKKARARIKKVRRKT